MGFATKSCYKVVSGDWSRVFTLAHASLCPGNAEEEKSRVGEGSLCLWSGDAAVTFLPRRTQIHLTATMLSGASVAALAKKTIVPHERKL